MPKVRSSNIGYPRIGEKREWKKVSKAIGQIILPKKNY